MVRGQHARTRGVGLPASAAGGPNLASGKTASVSGVNGVFGTGNLNDGNPATYWESTNNAFPQWAQIDLGAATSVNQVILKLPPATAGPPGRRPCRC